MTTMEALSRNLRTLRTLHGLSQKQLAERVGVSHPRISELECGNGDPKLHTLEKIAKAFGTTVSALLQENLGKFSA